MSVETHHADHRVDTEVLPTRPSRSVALVVAGSLAAGAVTALVLTLVVFAGATESVITGAILLAFGFGWALIASLTTRLTSQPQRWTVLPAIAMTATGLGLLTFTPEDAVLTRLSWVWPPLVLALTVWMVVSMRRALTGRGQWLLAPVVVVLGVAAIGTTYENIAAQRDQDTYAAPGRSYDVGGHRLHLDCHGQGGPTVLLSNGLGEISASWARIVGQVGDTTRVCAYDRAGQGWSEDAESPQDGVAAAKDLHALLAVAGEHGPFVLVGHSIGGTYAMTYAARYADQIAGLVLLDSSSPEQLTAIPSFAGQFAVMRRVMALLPTVSRLGAGHVLTPASHLPAAAADRVRALASTARAARNGRDELSVLLEVFEQAQALTTLHGRPLAILTASESLETPRWAEAQKQLAGISPNHVHRTVHATHPGLLEDRHGSTESVRAINDVVTAVRTGTGLDTQ